VGLTVSELFVKLCFKVKDFEGVKRYLYWVTLDWVREGYEVFILQSLLEEVFDNNYLPLVIHFEKKVLMDQDTSHH
jgi:hypothetical protein